MNKHYIDIEIPTEEIEKFGTENYDLKTEDGMQKWFTDLCANTEAYDYGLLADEFGKQSLEERVYNYWGYMPALPFTMDDDIKWADFQKECGKMTEQEWDNYIESVKNWIDESPWNVVKIFHADEDESDLKELRYALDHYLRRQDLPDVDPDLILQTDRYGQYTIR